MSRLALTLLVLSPLVSASAADPALSAGDHAAAHALQGEYAGTVTVRDNSVKVGVQVIALGDGKFRAVAHHGGLPGAGWDGSEKVVTEGTASDGVVTFKGPSGEGRLADGKLTIVVDGNEVASFEKVTRKSPTLGAKPPEGAVVLHAGADDVDKWKGGKVDAEGNLQQGITSKETFAGPFTLHMEFMLSFMPKASGQGRSNSGVYLQGRHEVQILDSFGLSGEHNECGGLYSVKKPDVNMCFPPLVWQTYDIDFTPAKFENGTKVASARMTVRHNGVLVHDDVEVPKSSTASPLKEGAEPGPIYIQNHGNPLRFRNIWVAPKK